MDDGVTIPMIWIALALSLLLHAVALWVLMPRLDLTRTTRGDPRERMNVNLAPSASPPPSASTAPRQTPKKAPQPAPAAPVIALERPAPSALPPPEPATRPPAANDLASFIEARRRARAESTPTLFQGCAEEALPIEDDKARSDRIVAANLDSKRVPSFRSEEHTSERQSQR